jgi:hypothetical protein
MTIYSITNKTNNKITIDTNNDTIHFLEYGPYSIQVCMKETTPLPKYNLHYFDVNNYYYNSEIFIRIYFDDDLQVHFDNNSYNLELFGDTFSESDVIRLLLNSFEHF